MFQTLQPTPRTETGPPCHWRGGIMCRSSTPSLVSPPLVASMQNAGQAGPAGALSHFYAHHGVRNLEDVLQLRTAYIGDTQGRNPRLSHFLQSSFPQRPVMHRPEATVRRGSKPRSSATHTGSHTEFTQRPRRTCGCLGFLETTAPPEIDLFPAAKSTLWPR